MRAQAVAEARQLSGFSHLAAIVVGLALGLMLGMLGRAYAVGALSRRWLGS
jgi:hypothetical protein